jgi:hypothetical protein
VLDTRALLRERHAKFRQMGQFRVEQFHGPSGNGTPA